jgi:hypothetical protein
MFNMDVVSRIVVGDSFDELYMESPLVAENQKLRESVKSLAATLEVCIARLQKMEGK